MTEPKYENFEDPKDYFSAKCDWLQARVQELEERLAAYTPLPGYNVIHSENTRLREALESIAVNAKDEFSSVTATAALKEKP